MYKLYSKLPEDIKIELKNTVNLDDFELELKCAAKVFVKWRYIYEIGIDSINFQFLFLFSKSLKKISSDLILKPWGL